MMKPTATDLQSGHDNGALCAEPAPLSHVARQFLANRLSVILGRLAAINSHLGDTDNNASCRLNAVQNEIVEIGAWAGLPGFVCRYPSPAAHH
jgi:hypothetical protein